MLIPLICTYHADFTEEREVVVENPDKGMFDSDEEMEIVRTTFKYCIDKNADEICKVSPLNSEFGRPDPCARALSTLSLQLRTLSLNARQGQRVIGG